MASDAQSLYGIAAELLAKAAAILAGTPAGAPANQYVAHGPPAYDCCDSLIVNAGTLGYGPYARGFDAGSAANDPKMPVVPYLPLTVTALRCVNRQAMPDGGVTIRPPLLAAIAEDAKVVYADGWSLFCGLRKAYLDRTLFAGFPCRASEIAGALPISPEGGCLGWSIDVYVQLDGFDPPGA